MQTANERAPTRALTPRSSQPLPRVAAACPSGVVGTSLGQRNGLLVSPRSTPSSTVTSLTTTDSARLLDDYNSLHSEHTTLQFAHAAALSEVDALRDRCAQLEDALKRVCAQRQDSFEAQMSEVKAMSSGSRNASPETLPNMVSVAPSRVRPVEPPAAPPPPSQPPSQQPPSQQPPSQPLAHPVAAPPTLSATPPPMQQPPPSARRPSLSISRDRSVSPAPPEDAAPVQPQSPSCPPSPGASKLLHRRLSASCTDDLALETSSAARTDIAPMPPLPPIVATPAPSPHPPSPRPPSRKLSPSPTFPPAIDVSGDTTPSPPRRAAAAWPRLKRFGLHFSPPGLALEYELGGERLFKHLDLELSPNADVEALADHVIENEPMVSVSRRPHLCRVLQRLITIVATYVIPEEEGYALTASVAPMVVAPPNNPDAPELVQLSRAIKDLCRHDATREGVAISADGWVGLVDALEHLSTQLARPILELDVRQVVAGAGGNVKKRFELREATTDGTSVAIRAAQGHTMQNVCLRMGTLLDESTAPILAVHGSYYPALTSIRQNGLSRMRRHHVHLAKGLPGSADVLSGARDNCDVFIWVNVHRAIRAGIRFFESSNGVILCEGDPDGAIPPRFFERIELKEGEGLVETPIGPIHLMGGSSSSVTEESEGFSATRSFTGTEESATKSFTGTDDSYKSDNQRDWQHEARPEAVAEAASMVRTLHGVAEAGMAGASAAADEQPPSAEEDAVETMEAALLARWKTADTPRDHRPDSPPDGDMMVPLQ